MSGKAQMPSHDFVTPVFTWPRAAQSGSMLPPHVLNQLLLQTTETTPLVLQGTKVCGSVGRDTRLPRACGSVGRDMRLLCFFLCPNLIWLPSASKPNMVFSLCSPVPFLLSHRRRQLILESRFLKHSLWSICILNVY